MDTCHIYLNCLFTYYFIKDLFNFIFYFRTEDLYYGDLFIANDNEVNSFVNKTRNPDLDVCKTFSCILLVL